MCRWMSPHLPAPPAVWSAGSSHYLHWSLHHLFPFCCQSWQPINAVLHAACTFLLTGSAGHLLSTQSIPSGSQPYISQDTLTASPSLALIFLVVCVLFSLSRTRMVLQVASPVSIWYCSIIQYVLIIPIPYSKNVSLCNFNKFSKMIYSQL